MHALIARRGFPWLIGLAVWVVGAAGLLGFFVWGTTMPAGWFQGPLALWVSLPAAFAAVGVSAVFQRPKHWAFRLLVIGECTAGAFVGGWLFFILFLVFAWNAEI